MVALGDLFATIVFSLCGAVAGMSHLAQYILFTILIAINTIGFRWYYKNRKTNKTQFQKLKEDDYDDDFDLTNVYPQPDAPNIQPL